MSMDGIRFSGLASGMDTQSIVKQLMQAERMPLDKLEQKKQTLEWKRDNYREVNTLLDELDKFIFDGVGKQSTFYKKSITSSNDNIISATSVGAPPNTTTQLEVLRLATSESWNSEVALSFPPVPAKAFTAKFKVVDPDGTARTKDLNLKAEATIDDVIREFNNLGLGVNAVKGNILDNEDLNGDGQINDYREMVVLTQNKTGSGASLSLVNEDAVQLMNELGFRDGTGAQYVHNATTPPSLVAGQNGQPAGQDAVVKVNGLQMTFKNNSFDINGIKYTAKDLTNNGASGNPVTISSSTDVDGVMDSVMKFMEKYNEIIKKIDDKLKEDRYKEYAPLTKEQREQLSETEIEQWEKKAKSGLLRRDTILQNGLSQIRNAVYGKVSGLDPRYDFLAEAGIVTSPNYLENGKLLLNPTKQGDDKLNGEERLRKIIEEDPEALYQLFYADGSTTSEKGIARRLRDSIKNTISDIEGQAGKTTSMGSQYGIGRELNGISNRITAFEDRLTRVEERYWGQFTAMEKAMQRANEQAAYIANALGGGAGNA
ncbi:flagellar hook-associated protein 2 [Bacillus sp. AK128]